MTSKGWVMVRLRENVIKKLDSTLPNVPRSKQVDMVFENSAYALNRDAEKVLNAFGFTGSRKKKGGYL